MSSADDVKVAMTYFPTQSDNIRMNKVITEPTPLHIIKFKNYLQKCAINIPTDGEALGLLGTVLSDTDYESVNNNQTWVAPMYPDTAPVLPMASADGASTIPESDKSTKHTNRLLQHQHNLCQN